MSTKVCRFLCLSIGLGNISILSPHRDIYCVQYQYRQHFIPCNNIACAILLQILPHIAVQYYRIASIK